MSLSKMELHSDAILIKDYSPSIGAVRPDHIFSQPRVTHLKLGLETESMSLCDEMMVSKAHMHCKRQVIVRAGVLSEVPLPEHLTLGCAHIAGV
jgi:hypothetical protein